MSKSDTTTNVKLLKIIKRFPEIYNSQHDLANDKAHGMVVWETISYELETPVNVLKKKWRKLCSMHKKKYQNLKTISKNYPAHPAAPLPQDDISILMDSMLETPDDDSPGDTDDGSSCSVPTLSIISEEDRSTRSSSNASTLVGSERRENSRSLLGPRKILPEVSSSSSGSASASASASASVPAFGSSSSFSSAPFASSENNSGSTRVLRSHNKLRLIRATRSGPPELTRNRPRDSSTFTSGRKNSVANFVKIRSKSTDNRDKKNNDRFRKRTSNETAKVFFKNISSIVAKFPQDIQTATKNKIYDIVTEADSKISSSSSSASVTIR